MVRQLKEKKLNLLFLFILGFFITTNVYANNVEPMVLCETQEVLKVFKIGGAVLFVIKILIPLIIMVMGSIDFGKAMMSGDDKEIAVSSKKLLMRFIAGIVIFFIPTITTALFKMVYNYTSLMEKSKACTTCLLQPYSNECETNIATSNKSKIPTSDNTLDDRSSGQGGTSSVGGGDGASGGGSGGGSR